MQQCSLRWKDPFVLTGERSGDREVLKAVFGGGLTREERDGMPPERRPKPVMAWKSENSLAASRTWKGIAAFMWRVVVAAVGAAFLIGPMWLMMLNTALYTGLISTTIFVTVFGFLMACVLQEPKDVLSSTAAYAAVLVVFVGLTTGS